MLTSKQKKQIINGFLGIVELLTDKHYQIRAWVNGESFDFDETVCRYFDLSDPILENHKDFQFTDIQYFLLKSLSENFRIFAHENDFPEEFIDTPEWNKITEMAKELLKAF